MAGRRDQEAGDGQLYQLDTALANGGTPPTVKSVPLGDALAGVVYAIQYPP